MNNPDIALPGHGVCDMIYKSIIYVYMNHGIRKKLLILAKEDQAARRGNLPFRATDRRHSQQLRRIIERHGWPGRSLVGRRGAAAAWLLAQHADHDVHFQEHCLHLLKQAVANGEASEQEYAYLLDRISMHRRRKQWYGTQFHLNKKGELVPWPIRNPHELKIRRKSIGLEPFIRYASRLKRSQRRLDQPHTRVAS